MPCRPALALQPRSPSVSKPFIPHEYQRRGIELLKVPGGSGLFLDPGMGKTACALMAFKHLLVTGRAKRMLVIAPIGPMYDTWQREPLKWNETRHLFSTILHGPKKEHRLFHDTPIHIVNPEGVIWLFDHETIASYDVLCVDESTRFKSWASKRFKKIKPQLINFEYRWCLTGTMAPNGLMDMFGQSYVMDRGKALGKYITTYRTAFFTQDWGGYTYTPKPGALEKVGARLAGHCLRLEAEDYLDMPTFNQITIEVELPTSAQMLYKAVEDEYFVKIADSTIIAANKAVAGIKCRQIANGAVYDDAGDTIAVHEGKIRAMETIVEETNGHPLMVMYEFQHDRRRLQALFGKNAVCVTGMKGRNLSETVAAFNAGTLPVLLCHPGTMAGMNIHGVCHHIVWFSIPWNLEHYIQSNWRLYRQGQTSKMVYCYHLTAQATLDARVAEVLSSKETAQADLARMLDDTISERADVET